MGFGVRESQLKPVQSPPLYSLAERMCDEPGGYDRYNYAKCVWLGNPDRSQRLAGQHPWPTRIRNGERYIYSVPVLAGVDAEQQRILYVGKDDWKPVEDPNAWLVAERGLLSGEEIERTVLSSRVNSTQQLRLQLAPASFDNFPPLMKEAMRRKPAYDQIALTGNLDDQYILRQAQLREGLGRRVLQFEDIEALESMIVAVQQLRLDERNRAAMSITATRQAIGEYSIVAADYAA